uniref:Glycosyltransferase n=1 Tax=Polygala tenuifolia TaxID=355332 RepID=A0A4P2X5X0_9FABA|nr:UDP-glycosyltransferase [Polygala tenuifolia]
MGCQTNELHFVLFPLMAQGHIIPMIDIAKMLAQRGVVITIVTTPHNASRFEGILTRAVSSGLQIRIHLVQFPYEQAGVPQGCENVDMIPSGDMVISFFDALSLLQQPAEELFACLKPKPSCIISDMCFPWTVKLAEKHNIPRIVFHGFSCFCLLCSYNIHVTKVQETITSDSEYFAIPDIPDHIEVTKAQLPNSVDDDKLREFREQIADAEMKSFGAIINTFEELEEAYVKAYKKARNLKVWCLGPVSLCNKDELDKAQRGNKAAIDEHQCLKWLDMQKPNSVIYVCFGSICNLLPLQLIELALGLEASNRPFIWAIRGWSKTPELDKWIKESGFAERTKERGLVIQGWAPQVLILSHLSIGGFITHCGWNSTLEAITCGVPMITWPLFADQFLNEKLVVRVLDIAVSLGVEKPMKWGEEEKIGILVNREDVRKAIQKLMGEEEENPRRKKAREFGEKARRAVEEGGSSHLNLTLLIQDIMQQTNRVSELEI